MEHVVPTIDWRAFYEAGEGGRFVDLLVKLPQARWTERDVDSDTLLHYACRRPNVAAVVVLLQSVLVNVSARNTWGGTPAHWGAFNMHSRVLEVLCAAGADLRALSNDGDAPIDYALRNAKEDRGESVRVLVANGVRLSTARARDRQFITPELEAFERGVLCCRAAVVAMLRVKRAGKLVRWDKFLLLEIAVCTWATRYDKGWQTAAQQQQEELVRAMLPLQ